MRDPTKFLQVGEAEMPFSVLVVDDELGLLLSLEQLLVARDYQVAVATSGAQALEQLRDTRYDLLLLDLAMPGTGGAAVLDHVITQRLDMAVIVISGPTRGAKPSPALARAPSISCANPLAPKSFSAGSPTAPPNWSWNAAID